MRKSISLLIILIIMSCGRNSSTSNNAIDILSPPESEISNLSELTSDIEYIPLMTSDSSLIGRISEIKVSGNIVYVRAGRELFCFDKTGKYLYKLNKTGRGPGEYQDFRNFDINSDGDRLVLLTNNTIMLYNVTGNKIIFNKLIDIKSEATNPISNIRFIPGRDNILISYDCFGNETYRNLIINLNGDTLNNRPNYYKFINEKNMMGSSGSENIDFIYNNSLFFKEWESDTVFTLDKMNNIKPHIVLDTKGKQPTPGDFTRYLNLDISTMMTTSPTAQNVVINLILETDRYFFFRYTYLKEINIKIYDKKLKKILGINPKKFLTDDIAGGVDFMPFNYSDGKYLYSWVDALSLKKQISKDEFKALIVKSPQKRNALELTIKSIKETDNPVLIIVSPDK